MQPRLKQLLWVAGALLAAVGISTVPASAGPIHPTLTVGCSAGPNNYHTIQAAVNNAGDNYTVHVCRGNYTENVNVNDATKHGAPPFDSLDGLQIVADDGVRLQCPGNGNKALNGSGFDLHAYAVTIQGFEIKNCASAISVESGFAGEKFVGNDLHDNVVGISFNSATGYNSVIDNQIHQNSEDGVFDFGAEGDYIFDNDIQDNGGNGIQISTANIEIGGLYTAVITDNDIENNRANGVYLNNADDVVVNQNELSDNGNDGLYSNTSSYDLYFGNDADKNNNIGIELSSGSHNDQVDDNRMENNGAFDASDHDTNGWLNDSCKKPTAAAVCVNP